MARTFGGRREDAQAILSFAGERSNHRARDTQEAERKDTPRRGASWPIISRIASSWTESKFDQGRMQVDMERHDGRADGLPEEDVDL